MTKNSSFSGKIAVILAKNDESLTVIDVEPVLTRDWNDQTRGELLISNRMTSERQTRIDMVNRLLSKGVALDDALFIGDPDDILTEKDRQMLKA